MGIAASASASASSPPPEAAAPADPPPKQGTHPASSPPPRPAAPADPSPKPDAPGDYAGEAAETVVLDPSADAGEQEGKGEEEGECGFCLFMKGGGCKEEFVVWEKCVEEAEVAGGDDVVERCYEATAALRKCMDAHAEYYEPILRAERAMAEDLEAAMASEASEPSPPSPPATAEKEQRGDSTKQAEEEAVVKEKEDREV